MTSEGYIKLFRKVRRNVLWEPGRERTKLEAWLDMLMEAQHAADPRTILIGMTPIISRQGDCLKSLQTWATRWKWTVSRVRRFFVLLEKCSMIERKSEGKTTRISICNYKIYHNERINNETIVNRQRNDSETIAATDKKGKNVKNEKKKSIRSLFVPPTPQEVKEYSQSLTIPFDIDSHAFCSFYESKGWMVGKNKMKSWKAAVRTWQGREQDKAKKAKPKPKVIPKCECGKPITLFDRNKKPAKKCYDCRQNAGG